MKSKSILTEKDEKKTNIKYFTLVSHGLILLEANTPYKDH